MSLISLIVFVCFPGVVTVVASDDCSLYSLMLKVLPALAMGNTHTPGTFNNRLTVSACPFSEVLGVLTESFLLLGNSVIVVPGRSTAPPALLLAQLFIGAGLPAGALNILTGSNVSLGAKVAQSPSISYVTYCGNKQVHFAVFVENLPVVFF